MTLNEAIEVFEYDTSDTILNLSELRSDELANWLRELKDCRDGYKGIKMAAVQEYKEKIIVDVSRRAQQYELNHKDMHPDIFNNATRTFIEALGYFEKMMKREF